MPSRLPFSCSRPTAVFGPTPFTPGMLSELSPVRALRSTTSSGGTPSRAITASRRTSTGPLALA